MWHPFMPFVTEQVWKTAEFGGDLIVAKWPTALPLTEGVSGFDVVRSLVTDMRRLRLENGIEPAKQVAFAIAAPQDVQKLLEENNDIVKTLVRASSIAFNAIPEGWALTVSGGTTVGLDLAGAIDMKKERAKTEKEVETTERYIASLGEKMKNREFMEKAPLKVKEDMDRKYGEAEAKLAALKERMKSLLS